MDLYVRDLHYRVYRNMSAADRIRPGFPDVERLREDCDIKHKEQGYLHREEVQWGGVMGVGGILLSDNRGGTLSRIAECGERSRLFRLFHHRAPGAGATSPTS